ncbi:MAG TPA: hypothetical protein PLP70_00065 [bacterium]|jgi:hypothetical protein|nr:hypothetical protein [bacterium]
MSKKKKSIILIIILLLVLLLSFHSCFRVEVTRKPSTKSLVYIVLDRLGVLSEKVNDLSADVDTIKVDVRELKGRKTPRVVYKTIKIVQPAQSLSETREPQQPQQPQEMQQEPPKPETAQAGTIIPGPIPGPQDLLFCIDLEPKKANDSSKKFLFWELCNNLGYNISNVVPNTTGKPANMRLSPGGSADGIVFDGETLRISASSLNAWYSQIFGVPMPPDFRPGIRSNKSGWQTKLMSRSGDYFVYRF